jgi:hypothetical protein
MTVKTDRTDCSTCGERVILARGFPPLDWWPSQYGVVAAQHTASGAWVARFLGPGDGPAVPEKRYAVHTCEQAEPGLPGRTVSD